MQMYLAAGLVLSFDMVWVRAVSSWDLGCTGSGLGPYGDVPAAAAAASATALAWRWSGSWVSSLVTPCALAEGAGGAAGGTGTAWSDKTDWTGPVLKAGKKKEKD